MKEKLLFLFFISLFSFSAISQSIERSVLASDGSSNTIGNLTLDWTLGELATSTLVTDSGLLTQGFHQPSLTVSKLLTYEELADYYTVQLMPNPVSSMLTVRIESERQEPVSVDLMDLNGKLLEQVDLRFPFQPLQLNLTFYPSGLYVVRVKTQSDKPVGMFKVNKQD